jgi:hypothetical protein
MTTPLPLKQNKQQQKYNKAEKQHMLVRAREKRNLFTAVNFDNHYGNQ